MNLQLPRLPYAMNELRPLMSERTVSFHYNRHHRNYVETTNRLLQESNAGETSLENIIRTAEGALYNNAAQAWNHTFFWLGLCSPGKCELPEDGVEFSSAIADSFGSWTGAQKAFTECAKGLFGSGYTWLVADLDGRLKFVATANADNPLRMGGLRPLWTCDLWEHAYYLDYQNARSAFVANVWGQIEWRLAEKCFLEEAVPDLTRFMVPGSQGAAVDPVFHPSATP